MLEQKTRERATRAPCKGKAFLMEARERNYLEGNEKTNEKREKERDERTTEAYVWSKIKRSKRNRRRRKGGGEKNKKTTRRSKEGAGRSREITI